MTIDWQKIKWTHKFVTAGYGEMAAIINTLVDNGQPHKILNDVPINAERLYLHYVVKEFPKDNRQ